MARKTVPSTPEELARLKQAMDAAELDFDNAKLAYFHRAEYKGQAVNYEVMKRFAEEYIAANYAYQKAAYGRVRVKLSVPHLMRE